MSGTTQVTRTDHSLSTQRLHGPVPRIHHSIPWHSYVLSAPSILNIGPWSARERKEDPIFRIRWTALVLSSPSLHLQSNFPSHLFISPAGPLSGISAVSSAGCSALRCECTMSERAHVTHGTTRVPATFPYPKSRFHGMYDRNPWRSSLPLLPRTAVPAQNFPHVVTMS